MSASASSPDLGTARETAPLPLVQRLVDGLAAERVRYCHWKSNAHIDRSASGENDLDLLVDRAQARRFTEVLSRLGFSRVRRGGEEIPGIESFFGYDATADRLVHVHAHYQLVVGDDRTKNYRIPVEEPYLRSAAPSGVFPLPSAAFEYVVLVIRMVLKYCTWDEIAWNAIRGRRARPKRTEREELALLTACVDRREVETLVERELPYLGSGLFVECLAALAAGSSPRRRIMAARRLERSLQPHGRRSRRADRALRIWRRVAEAAGRRTGRRARKGRLAGGGAMIALIGGDGSGKSTAVTALARWLEPVLELRVVHLGKPPWSATTYAARASLKVAAAAARALERLVPAGPTRRLAASVTAYRSLIWLLLTARDRRRAYRDARRFAIGGGVVLCDRYPHRVLRSMEVPQIARLAAGRVDGPLVRAMAAAEERLHHAVAAPDLLVLLRLDPEIAVARKPGESPESVRARGGEIWHADWRDAGVRVVDASRSPDEVAGEVKALAWEVLT